MNVTLDGLLDGGYTMQSTSGTNMPPFFNAILPGQPSAFPRSRGPKAPSAVNCSSLKQLPPIGVLDLRPLFVDRC